MNIPTAQALILAGGRGTRLGTLTADMPKPLLKVGGRPFLEYIIDELWRQGFREVVLLGGFAADRLRDWAETIKRSGLEIRIVVEPEPAGTAGALKYAADLLASEFLLLNGDSLFDINLLDLATAQFDSDWLAAMALASVSNASRFGVAALIGDQVRYFAERSEGGGAALVNGGVYRLRRDLITMISSGAHSLESELFPRLALCGALAGRIYNRPLVDIGVREAYADAQKVIPEVTRRGAIFFDRDGVLNRDVGYPHRPDQIEWEEGAFEAIKAVNDAGFFVFVVTNQAGVARGLYGESQVRHLHAWMNEQLRLRGAHVDEFVYSPYHPTEGLGLYKKDSDCRKPKPGMVRDILSRWPIDRARCALIGDKNTDMLAAAAAGIFGVLYSGGGLDKPVEDLLTRVSQWCG